MACFEILDIAAAVYFVVVVVWWTWGSQMHHCSTNHYATLGYFSTSESHDALTTQIT